MNCPYLDSSNPHCSENLSIKNLEEAFELCTNHYMMCPIYLQLSQGEKETVAAFIKTN
ncbi:MAG: hypothetical protein JW860_07040 [Sedimentisphaerales bacterium]|nr:hypothetical protein [Sedimentisphaerales bacterium]